MQSSQAGYASHVPEAYACTCFFRDTQNTYLRILKHAGETCPVFKGPKPVAKFQRKTPAFIQMQMLRDTYAAIARVCK